MRTLVIDSATAACSVALFDDGDRLAHDFRLLGRGHAELLVPMIAALPGRGQAERIAVALGPGSFTGVRVGLAAARALGFAWGSQICGYATLDLVAAIAGQQLAAHEPFGLAMIGGHGEWFVQRFAADALPLGDFVSCNPDAALEVLADAVIAGDAAEAAVARRGWGSALPLMPDAGAFMLLDAARLTNDIRLRYGREPDARLPDAALPDTAEAIAAR